MNITAYLSTHAKEYLAEAFGHLLDDGTIFIYDGKQPKPDGKVTDQRVLVEVVLPSPAFDPVDNGVMRGSHIGISKKAVATGHASWAECMDRFGNVILRGPAGAGSEFFCDLSSTYIEQGGTVLIRSMTYRI